MDKANGGSETLYDVLKVRNDCSDKDIRNAYVQLSKQYHPDAKGGSSKDNKDHTAHFLKISEAYQTLSKPKLRREYDEILKASQNTRIIEVGKSTKTVRPWEIKPDYDPNPGPYYGINGVRRTTNFKVAAAIIFLGIAGGIFGFFSVRHSFAINQERLDEISAKASAHHQRIRTEVNNSTREENIRRFVERVAADQSSR
ncbi:dnaJ-like protein 60 [Musca vetustissima]|uniref:dnaJ-like protein 60 n=1 Tax=Musca vetustissima TaxID=27455 RepID=UPI002AB75296|nr:dnaJ-like protein 60 [Musca vetustissima]